MRLNSKVINIFEPTIVPVVERPLRVLVAEDDYLINRLLDIYLKNWGHQATLVNNGKAAVAKMAEAEIPYDYAFIDHFMPEMDGLVATGQIKQIAQARGLQTKVVFLTCGPMFAWGDRITAAGADACILKPFAPRDLVGYLGKYEPNN